MAALAFALAVAASADASSLSQSSTRGQLVGVLRSDGVVVPFAELSGGRWLPAPIRGHIVEPATLADMEKPWFGGLGPDLATWYAWPSIGQPRTLHATALVPAESHCQRVWGLRTGSRRGRRNAIPVAVALTQHATASAFEVLAGATSDWQRIERFVTERFDGLESVALHARKTALESGEEARGVPDTTRVKEPVALRHVFRTRDVVDERVLFYVEGARSYREPADRSSGGCEDVSYFSGWLQTDALGHLEMIDGHVVLTGCDLKDVLVTTPLGVFRWGSDWFIAAQEGSYEGDQYAIYEIRGDDIRVVHGVYAGGC